MADSSTYAIRQQALAQIRSVMENHAVEAEQYPLFRSDGRLPSSPEQMDEFASVLAACPRPPTRGQQKAMHAPRDSEFGGEAEVAARLRRALVRVRREA